VILAQSGAFSTAFAWVLGLTVLSVVPAFFLPGRKQIEELAR